MKKIAIISAFIGNGGKTGSISFTDAAKKQLEEYGVDVYNYTDSDISKLVDISEPKLEKSDLELKFPSAFQKRYLSRKYKQPVYPTEKDNRTRLLAKIPKILFYKLIHKEYDYYIWLDSKFIIEDHWLDYILWLIRTRKDFDVLVSKHSERNSVKEEVDFMLKYGNVVDWGMPQKYNLAEIAGQYQSYKNISWFKDEHLYELTMIIYNASILNKKQFCEEWYAHNYYITIQDQLSFPFLVQKNNIKVCEVVQRVFDMPFSDHEYSYRKRI